VASTTKINALRKPDQTDAPLGGVQISNLADDVDSRVVGRFTNIAARDLAIPSPQQGMICHIAAQTSPVPLPARYMGYSAGAWRQISPGVIASLVGTWYDLPDSGNNDGIEVWGSDPQILGEIQIPDYSVPFRVQAGMTCEAGSSQYTTRWDITMRLDSATGTILPLGVDIGDKWVLADAPNSFANDQKVYKITTLPSDFTLTGAHTIYVVANTGFKPAAPASPALGRITPFNRSLIATIHAA
jgi:hypothetical protein